MASGLDLDVGDLVDGIVRYDVKVASAVNAAMRFHATSALAYARQNAPWTDRTGNARQGLFTRVDGSFSGGRGTASLTIGHGVPYGIFLESRWSGRYAIVGPTIQREFPLIFMTIGRMIT